MPAVRFAHRQRAIAGASSPEWKSCTSIRTLEAYGQRVRMRVGGNQAPLILAELLSPARGTGSGIPDGQQTIAATGAEVPRGIEGDGVRLTFEPHLEEEIPGVRIPHGNASVDASRTARMRPPGAKARTRISSECFSRVCSSRPLLKFHNFTVGRPQSGGQLRATGRECQGFHATGMARPDDELQIG